MKERQKMYHVYLIQNLISKRIYIGFTENLKKRIKKHNGNSVKSTKNKGEWKSIYCETYRIEKDAKIRENKLKINPRQKNSY